MNSLQHAWTRAASGFQGFTRVALIEVLNT
ncbi:hypothetical protein QF001_005154 [Paraburkholderia youngii]